VGTCILDREVNVEWLERLSVIQGEFSHLRDVGSSLNVVRRGLGSLSGAMRNHGEVESRGESGRFVLGSGWMGQRRSE
jgi:hypothetical protein